MWIHGAPHGEVNEAKPAALRPAPGELYDNLPRGDVKVCRALGAPRKKMNRADLLALTADDLSTLTNRGTLKRAERELDENEHTAELALSPEGELTARWSDGMECVIPAGAPLSEGRCSCPASGLCRHLVRTVLAYQRQTATTCPVAASPSGPWGPEQVSDDDLAGHYRADALARLREQFRQGTVVELLRGTKPAARFLLEGRLVRFLVPGDLRYTWCDCGEAAPCSHVPLAVWAFRQLGPERTSAVLAVGDKPAPAPAALLNDVEAALGQLAEHGVSAAPASWPARLARLETACRDADLVWPAEVLAELAMQQERYAGHDALFAPERVAELTGELVARLDAIRADTDAIPQALVRGGRSDRPQPLGSGRFIGLGCQATPAGRRAGKGRVTLTAYLQDSETGSVVVVSKEFAGPAQDTGEPPRPFADLAQASAVKGTSFATLGTGQLLLKGGKRTAGHQLLPGRASAAVVPQTLDWQGLRPPVLVEDVAELEARLDARPPSALWPRRAGEDFHVCAIARAEGGRFCSMTQTVQAVLFDAKGRRLPLMHPFTARGQSGAEALLALLTSRPDTVRFVSGRVRRSAGGLVIHPVCLVYEENGRRAALQPWIERGGAETAPTEQAGTVAGNADPLADYLGQLQAALGELLVLGLARADPLVARRWRDAQRRDEAVGLARLAAAVAALADPLERKAHQAQWDWRPAAGHLLRLAMLVRLAQDVTA